MNQSLNKMAAAILAMLCTLAASSAAEAQTRHQLKLHLPGIAVSGAAEPPASQQLQLSSTAIDFGNVATHTTVMRQVLASNLGGTTLSFKAAPTVTGSEAFNAGLTSCGATLPVGAECLAEVLFSPTSVGTHSGLLSFTTSLAGSPHKVSLAANAFNPVSLAAATLPAGTVGQAYAYDFKLLLGVSNEASPDKSQASWSGSGTLPSGLSLNSSTGVLSGTPTARNTGSTYTVIASYKNNQGQQVYTIQVGSDTLEVVQISAGAAHTCAVTPAGGVKCWGNNASGRLGDGTNTARASPADVVSLTSNVVSVAAGLTHTCAVTKEGAATCWGANSYGQLGDGSNTARRTPTFVSGLSAGVVSIVSGGYHSCALTATGAVKCWGLNNYGALGNGSTTTQSTPVDVFGLSAGASQISAGAEHTCAVTPAAEVKCWGRNDQGQLGDGTLINRTAAWPSSLQLAAVQVSAGESHTCAAATNGSAWCWGLNNYGQLGDGTATTRRTPVTVSGLTLGGAGISAGDAHTCGVTSAGGVKCWGNNTLGQLGTGTTSNSRFPANVVGMSSGTTSIASGGAHTCAAQIDGEAKCWGYNYYGQLGDKTVTNRTTPVSVSK